MSKPLILIVDDDAGIRLLFTELLGQEGFTTECAVEGAAALDILRRQKVGIVLLDVCLPDINGLDLLQRIKSDYPELVVICVTGEGGLDTAVSAFDYGAAGYFIKPVNAKEFVFRINEIWKKKQLELSLKGERKKLREANEELSAAYDQLKKTQSQIVQQEKMASIGQLAAGVAHEINNPVGFITSNLSTLGKYFQKLGDYLKFLEDKVAAQGEEAAEQMAAEKKSLKVRYVLEDIPDLLEESLEGTERVKKIVQNLKCFSRVDDDSQKEADINECLESTLNIVWNELKYTCEVHKEYGELPRTKCYANQLNQVFMNLLVNAGHAIEEKGDIHIKSWADDSYIYVSVTDNGCGIPPDIADRIFEPFFTTKEAGKGTGLGMSISHDIIQKHNGEISFTSEVGKGSCFTVKLPIAA